MRLGLLNKLIGFVFGTVIFSFQITNARDILSQVVFLVMSAHWNVFRQSLTNDKPPPGYPILLQALWHDAKGDWHTAHNMIDNLDTSDAAWVHAYLHRREGDLSNADYWYRRANRSRPSKSLDEEITELVEFFKSSADNK